MIRQATIPRHTAEIDDDAAELDDPFAGFLGRPAARDALWLGRQAPRYTSYPPATAFQDGFTPEAYKAVLRTMAPEEPVSLYLHVPFCQALCLYCGCHTCPTQRHERITDYLAAVHKELETIALTTERPRRISHLHFGGGSPNIMSEKDLGLMFGALARRFDLTHCSEIAMELDPRLITKAQARTLGLVGVTRVSLGVQDFDPDVQQAIGRVQPFEMVKAACDRLREAGVARINFDLMYGLPMQSPASVAETARKALELKPDRIAFFSYAHVPQVKAHQKALEQYILPGPHAALAMERAGRDVLREAGYIEIGMDHFARPSDPLAKAWKNHKLRRNFQGYTDDSAVSMLGLGASSIGRAPGGYFQNARDIDAYQAQIRQQGLATARGLRLSGEDKFRAAIIEELMCYMKVNLELVCREHHTSPASLMEALDALQPFEEAGIIKRQGYRIELAIPQRMAVRVIASVFDKTLRTPDAPVSRTA